MKKYIYIFIPALLLYHTTQAQQDINGILQNIEANNKTLRAENKLNATRKLDARTGNYLSNPTVELNQLWADRSVGGNINELAVVQSFDFPGVYTNKNKLADLKTSAADRQYAVIRQQILLTARQTCQQIIYLRKQHSLLEERAQNARNLLELYQKRLEQGDANQIELNKIRLEQLNTDNELRLNQIAQNAAQEQLQNLNGGIAITFTGDQYPETSALPDYPQLEADYLAADPALRELSGQTEIAEREIRLTRALSLPKFDLGYRRNGGSGEKMNGFRIGMSIPLWENKNTVKKAKAQLEYANATAEDKLHSLKSQLKQLYAQAETLHTSLQEYRQILSGMQNTELLAKALQAGQISMLDYLLEIAVFYESRQNYLNIERDYFDTLAQLLQYKL
ncbi:TolC family protein [Odoribacter lunatus]|uniref:TolC family protein n=1 Tax=Odoribacter lunatus TaxID=2941335 RepID=UPI00203D9BA3|nr:TolC family protein [Odoribacter lunatus]